MNILLYAYNITLQSQNGDFSKTGNTYAKKNLENYYIKIPSKKINKYIKIVMFLGNESVTIKIVIEGQVTEQIKNFSYFLGTKFIMNMTGIANIKLISLVIFLE